MISTTALAVVLGIGVAATGASKPVHACRPGQFIRLAANACRPSSCAAKKACNPCAVKKAGNPCAAGNPCNPCVAAGVATECVIPRLVGAYRSGNPCAAGKACSPCNPCAAANPCNPCAVSQACNPCAAGNKEPPELSDAEAVAAYDCVSPLMAKAYRKSCHPAAVAYRDWQRLSRVSYPAEAHGVRFMNNYANEAARADYGKWEAAGDMPSGSVLAKDSFIVGDDGKISVGPLFLMTKAAAGTNAVTRDWHYTMIMPSGDVRQDAAIQKFCNDCHRRAGAEDDFLMFLPLPFRISAESGG